MPPASRKVADAAIRAARLAPVIGSGPGGPGGPGECVGAGVGVGDMDVALGVGVGVGVGGGVGPLTCSFVNVQVTSSLIAATKVRSVRSTGSEVAVCTHATPISS